MKKMIAASLALMLAWCTPSSSAEPEPMEKEFRCAVTVTGSSEYTGTIERAGGSNWKIELTSPESAAGITLCYLADGKCSLELQGHTVVYGRDNIPQGGVFDLVTSAADMCIENKGVTNRTTDDGSKCSGAVKGMSFTAESTKGMLSSICIGDDIRAEFTELLPSSLSSCTE